MFARARLLQLTELMKGKLIVVYGDVVADRFIYGMPKRISREAPVLILRHYREDVLLGGAGNAINNIAALGGLPIPVAVLGDDNDGHALLDGLTAQGIDCSSVLRVGRYKTPTKVRILGGMPHAARQQIVRYDIEDHFDVTAEEAVQFSTVLREQMALADAALISDYGYGVVTPHLAATLMRYAHGKPVTLDSATTCSTIPALPRQRRMKRKPRPPPAPPSTTARISTAVSTRSVRRCATPSTARPSSSPAAAAGWPSTSATPKRRSRSPSTVATRWPTSRARATRSSPRYPRPRRRRVVRGGGEDGQLRRRHRRHEDGDGHCKR